MPGVLVLSGSGGNVREYETRLLAFHGFAALGLRYFGGDGLSVSLLHIPLEYGRQAIAWLQQHPRCRPGGVGIVGLSRGAELALLLGATYPEVRAVVGFSPSGVIWGPVIKRFGDRFAHPRAWLPGSGGGWRPAPHASWTLHGRPLPYLQPSLGRQLHAFLHRARHRGLPQSAIDALLLQDTAAVERATIPVERINGPVLLFSGDRDEEWPSTILSRMIMERLAAHHHPFPDEHISYPDGGHAFPEADYRDAWSRVIPFLHAALQSSGQS